MSNETNGGSLLSANVMHAAYEKCLPEIEAVTDSELVAMNTDVFAAVTLVLAAVTRIGPYRDAIVKLGVDAKNVDSLEDYALATGEADNRYKIAKAPPSEIAALNDEAISLRETIRVDATALAHHGFIDPNRLSAFKGLTGYKNVAAELGEWANLIDEYWTKIEGKTALTPALIQHAKDVAVQLARAAGVRVLGAADVPKAQRIREQAFSLMVRAYDQVRRGLSFLRWDEGDADTIAPTLYMGRPRGSKSANAGDTAATTTTNATETAPTNAASNGASNGASTATAPGMPGGSPLAS